MINFVRQGLVAVVMIAFAQPVFAGELSKEECVDAHSRGQDAKDQGKLSLARKLFLTCAQPTCPAVVQSDCARFADDLTRQQPSLSFAARDGNGSDLPDTTVYVDDILVVTRLDGKSHDVDPGTHTVRFANNGKDQVVTVVVEPGEKGRPVVATFGAPSSGAQAGGAKADATPAKKSGPKVLHPTGARVAIYGGAAMAIGGVGLGVLGMTRVPSNCNTSTNQCAAPPGDPAFGKASSAVELQNIGWIVGGVGVVALAGGVVWYITGKTTEPTEKLVMPWVTPTSAGLALTGHL